MQKLEENDVQLHYPSSDDIPDPAERGMQKEKVTYTLRALKEAELHLRYEEPDALLSLPASSKDVLERARKQPLVIKDSHEIPEYPFVLEELVAHFTKLNVKLINCIHGPYLLDLADPVSKVLIEWDQNWMMYPPHRRFVQEAFTKRKHRMLAHEGWKVLLVEMKEFNSMQNNEEKRAYLQRFINSHELTYLQNK